MLNGQRSDPEVSVRHDLASLFRLAAEARIRERCGRVWCKHLKATQELLRSHQSLRRDLSQKLTIKKLSKRRERQDRWVMLQSERLDATLTPPQQFQRAGINQQCHELSIPVVSPLAFATKVRPRDPCRGGLGAPKTIPSSTQARMGCGWHSALVGALPQSA
jgi:hypothetical protein